MASSSNIGLPPQYKGRVEQEQHRLGLDSKAATVRHIIDNYFAYQQDSSAVAQPEPSQPPTTPIPSEEKPNGREVQRYHVIA